MSSHVLGMLTSRHLSRRHIKEEDSCLHLPIVDYFSYTTKPAVTQSNGTRPDCVFRPSFQKRCVRNSAKEHTVAVGMEARAGNLIVTETRAATLTEFEEDLDTPRSVSCSLAIAVLVMLDVFVVALPATRTVSQSIEAGR